MLRLHVVINLFAPFMNVLFIYFSQEGELSEASIGWAGSRLIPGWRAGEEKVALPQPERGTGQRLARSAPKQLQLLPTLSLHLCTDTKDT